MFCLVEYSLSAIQTLHIKFLTLSTLGTLLSPKIHLSSKTGTPVSHAVTPKL